jgi:hypothetical protein
MRALAESKIFHTDKSHAQVPVFCALTIEFWKAPTMEIPA